jgi:hypothetical protein
VPDLRLDWDRIRARLGIVVEKLGEKIPQVPQPKPPEPDLPLASSSCPHPAGSFEKIEVMRRRVERGEQVFHPNDNREILVRQSHCARVG